MINTFIKIGIAILCLGLVGCSSSGEANETGRALGIKQSPIELNYAKGFTVDTVLGGFQRVTLHRDKSNSLTYILVPKGVDYRKEESEFVINTPINKIGLFSSSYIGYLKLLESIDKVSSVESKNYIYNEFIQKEITNGSIKEVGSPGQINLEQIIIQNPDIVLLSDMGGDLDSQFSKMKEAGIQIVGCAEWKEQTPLARAEWIKFFGAILDKEKLADSLFREIEANYKGISEKCKTAKNNPKAIFSSMYNGVWYMPGGESYVANLLEDAHGIYEWSNDKSVGSLALSLESVALKSPVNDIWINPQVNSISQLLNAESRYKQFVDNLTLGVFEQNILTNSFGGNDYWETGVVRPDLVLQDYAKMLHPDLFQDTQFTFFQSVK